ncbi:MAG: hypothetical protein K2H03_03505 [Muribaculaceae bacterium]|nr:hypothetical protein [Muribaculaceae bacterium]MDE5929528.1 hypothetical protein [Muribaculaceae bacterium]
MKKKILLLLMALPTMALLVAQNYKLLIRTNDGKEVSISTEDISVMEFVEEEDETGALATPRPTMKIDGNTYTFSWEAVKGANYYSWNLVGAGKSSLTSQTTVQVNDLTPGEYEFKVKALPADEQKNFESAFGSVSFTVRDTQASGEGHAQFIIENFTHNYARVTYFAGAKSVTAALVKAADAPAVDALQAYIDNLPASEKVTVNSTTEQKYNNLQPETAYMVVVTDGEHITVRNFTTEATPVPGTKGTVFPRGVSQSGGFIDVDKVDQTIWGSDRPLCWACATSAMCQWWLNDYEATQGHPYPTKHPIPEKSLYYSTPIMDIYCQAWYIQAGNVQPAIEWFFAGREHPEAYFVNSICGFNLDYEYVKGGWADMTIEEFKKYHFFSDRFDLYYGMDQAQVKAKFSDFMLGALSHGPVYFDISSGNHALLAWGAEYTVQPDGLKMITKLYIVENDLVGANVINGIQEATVDYSNHTGKINYPYIYSPTIYGGGGVSNGDIGNVVALKSWTSVNGD